eukprot:TRINITY_DN5704_c0_g1_i2.p1 TRINITY_DN5704_c0_g1~~TRINITY_DN5704_c0_g1_i2.p1  ORF type:complete len:544 (-),score=57.96 TRINITY_DN5704_c0_g1_i2:119-1603(-)
MILSHIPSLYNEHSDVVLLPHATLEEIEMAIGKLYRDFDGTEFRSVIWGPNKVMDVFDLELDNSFTYSNPHKISEDLFQDKLTSKEGIDLEDSSTKVETNETIEGNVYEYEDSAIINDDIDSLLEVHEIKQEEALIIKKIEDNNDIDIDYMKSEGEINNDADIGIKKRKKKRLKNGKKEIVCELCSEVFASRKSLKLHNGKEHGGKGGDGEAPRYHCTNCSMSFTFLSNLKRHNKIQHILKKGKGGVGRKKIKDENTRGSQKIQCDQCGKWFNWLQNLLRHKRVVHLIGVDGQGNGGNNAVASGLRCDACNLEFTRGDNLRRHMNLYHLGSKPGLKQKCDICQQQFRSKTRLFEHQKSVHGTVGNQGVRSYSVHRKDYQCTKCGQQFKRRLTLKEHMLNEHNIGAYYCQICDISLKTKDSLKYHRTKHNPKFSCEVCGKQIETQAKLNDHLNTHTGQKPYKCTGIGCDKCFTARGQLYHHIKKCQNQQMTIFRQ